MLTVNDLVDLNIGCTRGYRQKIMGWIAENNIETYEVDKGDKGDPEFLYTDDFIDCLRYFGSLDLADGLIEKKKQFKSDSSIPEVEESTISMLLWD